MWEKSRFLHADAGQSVPSWANDTQNDLGGLYSTTGFENENLPNFTYSSGEWSTLAAQQTATSGTCYFDGDVYGDLKNAVFNAVPWASSPVPESSIAKLNQWAELDMSGCFEINDTNDPTTRPFYYGSPLYAKLLGALNFWNFKVMFKVAFYYDGQFYENIRGAMQSYENNYGSGITIGEDWATAYGLVGQFPVLPIIKNNGEPVQTFNELQNYINPEGASPSLVPSSPTSDIMAELNTLNSTLAAELNDKGSALSNVNTTVTNLLGDYYDAVDFALDELGTKENQLNTALALCDSGDGGACENVEELATEVNGLRDDITELQSEQAVKSAIETALNTLAGGGSVGGSESLGDASSNIVSISNELATRQNTINNLNSQITSKNSEISQLSTSLSNAQGDVESLTNDLANQLDNFNAQISNKEDEIAEINQELSDATLEIANNEADILQKEATINSLSNQLTIANNDLTALTESKADVDAQLVSYISSNSALTGQIGDLTNNIASLTTQKDEALAEITILQSQATDNAATIQAKVAEITELNDQISTLNIQKDGLEADLLAQTNLTADRVAEINQLNATISTLNDQKAELDEDIAGLGQTINGLTSDIAEKNEQISNLQSAGAIDDATILGLQDERNELTAELNEVQNQKAALDIQVSDLNDNVVALTTEKAELELDLAVQENIALDLDAQLQEKFSEVATLEGELQAEMTKADNLQSDLDTAEADFNTLSDFLDAETESTQLLANELTAEVGALQGALAQYGYTPPVSEDVQEGFAGFSGQNFIDVVREAGKARREYLNFKGQVIQNAMNKQRFANKTYNFTKSNKRVKFRADGGESFEKKYGTLGKIGLIGGLLYLITKK